MKRLTLAVIMLLVPIARLIAASPADSTSRWILSTDVCHWAMLGTINAQAQLRLTGHWSIMAGALYNPFKYYNRPGDMICLKQATPYVASRYWFNGTFTGWYCEGKILASVYNVSLPRFSKYFEGEMMAAGIGAGYTRRLASRLSITAGAGVLAAAHRSTYYEGPVCGRITDARRGLVLLPDLTLSIDFIL